MTHREVLGRGSNCGKEVIFPCTNGALGAVGTMISGGKVLKLRDHFYKRLELMRRLVIKTNDAW
jgi:hypothetical protein